jgi:hypothetical protein
MSGVGMFAKWQREYAARGLPTFPVRVTADDKRPAVRNYLRIGSVTSARLAQQKQFADYDSFGLACGRQTGITVLDVDCHDERVLADALDRHGDTPFVVRTGSGNFQAWYRHNGEKRRIRAWGNHLPIDQLGGGYVVAPPSVGRRQMYEIIQGSLDDLPSLPRMRNAWKPGDEDADTAVGEGARNRSMWTHCMRHSHYCDTLDDVIDVAQTYNDQSCNPPLPDDEVIKVAKSAWKITEAGNNRIGQHGSWLTKDTVNGMIGEPYALSLLAFVSAQNGPNATFWVADGLRDKLGWPRRAFQKARRTLIKSGWIKALTKPSPGKPVEYRWGDARKQR